MRTVATALAVLGVCVVAVAFADDGRGYPRGGGGSSAAISASSVTAATGKFDALDAGVANIQGQLGVAGPIAGASTITGTELTATNGRVVSRNASGGFSFGIAGTQFLGMSAGSSTVSLNAATLDVVGTSVVNVAAGSQINVAGRLVTSGTAPTVVACSGTAASVTWSSGTASVRFDVGTSCAGETTAVITLPATTNCWTCSCFDIAADATLQQAFAGCTTTSFTMSNRTRATQVATDYVDNADIQCTCSGG